MNLKYLLFLSLFVLLHLFSSSKLMALNVTIIESQSLYTTDIMDKQWDSVLTLIGHNCTILPQSTLDNNSFFASTDVLIVSSGSITLPANRVSTIQQFLQTGKSVYLQGEYNCGLTSNQAFSSLVNNLGGTFTWGGTTPNVLNAMNILGSFSTTPQSTNNLSYFNYGCYGSGCGIQYFLENNAKFYGYFFCSPNPSYGSLIQTTDQDWIINLANDTLMRNIFQHLIDTTLCNATNFTPLNLGNDTILCNGSVLTLNATNSNATYLWQNGSTNPLFPVTTSGTYWVQVSNNCGVFSDTIDVNFTAAPNIELGNDTMICAGQPFFLNATFPGATYLWQDGFTGPTYNVTVGGIYYVTVNLSGCIVSDTIIVNIMPSPFVQFGNDTTLCDGQFLVLNATLPGATYLWQDGATSPTYLVSQSGFYSVSVTTSCGIVSDNINVLFKPSPQIDLGNDTAICNGTTIQLNTFQPNATYLWNDNSNLPSINISNAGVYWVEVTKDDCSARDSIQIAIKENPIVNLGENTILCKDQKLVLDASIDNGIYLWQDNSIGSQFTVSQKGLYWVSVTVNDCSSRDSIFVDYYPESCNCDMFIPNAFSPNNDGRNDEFKFVVAENNIDLKEFIIYNRWGQIAFKSQNINDSWNGKINGEPADIATYFYQIRYQCKFTKKDYYFKGDILLIR